MILFISGDKTIKQEEFFAIVGQAKKEKEFGGYEDFYELLKQYDKYENGRCMAAELGHILRALGKFGYYE